jgi:hypothetical protein
MQIRDQTPFRLFLRRICKMGWRQARTRVQTGMAAVETAPLPSSTYFHFGTTGQKWPQYKGLSPTPLALLLSVFHKSAGLSQGMSSRVPVRDWHWGPPNLLYTGYRGFSPEVKWPGREAVYSPQTSAEIKNKWIYTFSQPYVFMS